MAGRQKDLHVFHNGIDHLLPVLIQLAHDIVQQNQRGLFPLSGVDLRMCEPQGERQTFFLSLGTKFPGTDSIDQNLHLIPVHTACGKAQCAVFLPGTHQLFIILRRQLFFGTIGKVGIRPNTLA